MRRVVIIGCIIVGFLLLMIPNVNSIEYQNQKNIIISEIETRDYTSFMTMMKQITKDELRALLREAGQNKPDDLFICDFLYNCFKYCLFLYMFSLLPGLLMALIVAAFAKSIGCDWASYPETSSLVVRFSTHVTTPCIRCSMEE